MRPAPLTSHVTRDGTLDLAPFRRRSDATQSVRLQTFGLPIRDRGFGDYSFVSSPSAATAGGHGFTLRGLLRNVVICPAITLFSSTLP